MLKNQILEEIDWEGTWKLAVETLPEEYHQYLVDEPETLSLSYPVQSYPEKVKSLSFDKLEVIEGQLLGIKGQYLLLDDNRVLNIRKHNGYELRFEA